jgi:cyclopropane fatty-acyl-phospholipid synthase-like methyltransferase
MRADKAGSAGEQYIHRVVLYVEPMRNSSDAATNASSPNGVAARWEFRFSCAGVPVFFDPDEQLYHSIVKTENTAALYQEQYYEEGSAARFISILETAVRWFRRRRAAYIARYVKRGGAVLDIGCGNAYILYYLREEHGIRDVIGTQLSAPAQAFARDTL